MKLLIVSILTAMSLLGQSTSMSINAGPSQNLSGLVLPINMGGTGTTTAAGAIINFLPTPTRAGDVIYWNGTAWVLLAGNNSGTQVLEENASGVPSWATASGTGTLTSVAVTVPLWQAVTGSPITTSGTIAITGATGQTAAQVVGTTGGNTTVALRAIASTDLSDTARLAFYRGYAVDSSTGANAYVVALQDSTYGAASAGSWFMWKANSTGGSTATSTITINGTSRNIRVRGGQGTTSGDIGNNGIYLAVDDGTNIAMTELNGASQFTTNNFTLLDNTTNTKKITFNAASLPSSTVANIVVLWGGTAYILNGNCASSASPAVCGATNQGSATIAAGATSVVINTTAIGANSDPMATFDSSLGSKLSVTCNTNFQQPFVTARTAATSLTVSVLAAPVTNPLCFNFSFGN